MGAHSNDAGIGATNSKEAFGGATGSYFNGRIDDVRVYDETVLTAAEALALSQL